MYLQAFHVRVGWLFVHFLVLFVFIYSYLVIFVAVVLYFCFLMRERERKGFSLDGSRSCENLGGAVEGETGIRIHCVKTIYCQSKRKERSTRFHPNHGVSS